MEFLPSYIADLEKRTKSLTENDLEKTSGGIMNKKLAASVLTGLSILTITPNLTKSTVYAISPTVASQNEAKNQNINFEITKEQAIEDINYVLKIIKDNHVSSVKELPDEVRNQAEIEIKNLKNKVSVIDEWRIISRILAKLHDAHSKVLSPAFLNKRLSLDTMSEYGKFTVTNGEYKKFEITAINDVSISDLYKTFQNHFSYEVEEWTEHNFFETPSKFIPEWKLSLCGIDTSKPVKITFQKGNETKSQEFSLTEIGYENKNYSPWVSYEFDKEKDVGIFKLDECTYNDEYTRRVNEFFKGVHGNNIKNIVIDLRNNYGGTTNVILAFATYLKNIDKIKMMGMEQREKDKVLEFKRWTLGINEGAAEYRKTIPLFDGNVYILTSHGSFSAAMDFATDFSDNNWGYIIGEIPGNSPTGFGDATEFVHTSNGNLEFRTTFKKFYRPDESKDGTRLIPDVQVPAKDALNKVYEIIDEEKNYSHLETEHFDVIYPKSSKEQCEKALKELEESYDRVTGNLKVKVDKKTKIKLFKTKDDFHKAVGCYGFPEYTNYVNGTADNGFIKTHLELTPERIKEILVHEFTHISVENINNGHIPFVFNDGIATYEAGQSWLKNNLPNIDRLPEEPDWLIKGHFPKEINKYAFAYSFAEFIIKNYGYDKMIEFLKVDYQNNKFNFESIKDIYSKWKTAVLNN